MPVSAAEVPGPDAAYRRSDGRIIREAGGRVAAMLELDGRPENGAPGFDLLWFGDRDRWLVDGAILTISNPFAEAAFKKEPVRTRRGQFTVMPLHALHSTTITRTCAHVKCECVLF